MRVSVSDLIRRLLLYVLLGSSVTSAVAEQPESEAVIAALNYNFAKYANWPHGEELASIQLCYFSDRYRKSFGSLQDKHIFDKPVTVRQLSDIEQTSKCQLLFIDRSERVLLQRLFVHLGDKPVLTVSDLTGFSNEGGMIEILQVNNKFRFKVNLTRMQWADLNLSSQVLKLAVEVK